ncbi:NAD(P)H-dependent oxidoreductase [Streptomyces sp. NPDC006475]|uniref:FMN-dependent NADH-azoreductase n=1 Tax=Streptomyces sp. NPDC006475 TaxID=3155719 RepID=UPI00339F0502
MTRNRLLHVAASPRGMASRSRFLADVLVGAYQEAHPGAVADTFNLWDGTLPSFGPTATAAKMAVLAGSQPQGAQARAWAAVVDTFDRFNSYDRYVFSVPMWNGSVPYVLKQFIDVISQPGMVFDFSPDKGYTGLLTGKKAAVVYASGVYGPGRGPAFGSDFQSPFFDGWLRWAGIEDVTSIHLRPPTTDVDTKQQATRAKARQVGHAF